MHRPASDFEQRIYPPQTIAAIIAELGKDGIRAAAALEGTGLAEAQLPNHTTKISYSQIDRVIRNALRLSSDPTIAFRAGQHMHVSAYGMYGYALLSSTTVAEAIEFAERYLRVHGPFCRMAVSRDADEVVYLLHPMYWPDPAEDTHRFAVEFALAAYLTSLRDLTAQAFRFSRVALAYPAPRHVGAYRSLLDCPLLFDQRENEIHYAASWGDMSLALADPRSHAMARETCERLLGEVNRAGGVATDIRRILIEQPGQYPNIESIAARLEMHPRALRRRLEAEQTSYRDLLAEVRARLAIEYLRTTHMTNEEIASRLGYSDAANFRHAFTRWTGKSPSDFRSAERSA